MTFLISSLLSFGTFFPFRFIFFHPFHLFMSLWDDFFFLRSILYYLDFVFFFRFSYILLRGFGIRLIEGGFSKGL
ncbi:hypothetical protein LEP1GSC172_4343 [Leptospira noguchii]|uniref:Uncharacterized protein n=1 Tax=Leptospira noguchii TaxID=28182 RepID=M6VIF3_9LEPT|nr:hypothetical protein LEP1GSC172_4343 [Leptospira noguchii]